MNYSKEEGVIQMGYDLENIKQKEDLQKNSSRRLSTIRYKADFMAWWSDLLFPSSSTPPGGSEDEEEEY
jgi:hypothetical protein